MNNTIWLFSFFFWITGASLPYVLWNSAMAELPDGRGVILFGGECGASSKSKEILELCAGGESWNLVDVSLKYARIDHVVIPLI